MSQLFKRFRQDILGLIWLAITLFLALSLWSYSATDPSLNSLGRGAQVQNYCGYVGAFLADLIYQAFGLSGWFFVAATFRMGWRRLRGTAESATRLRVALAALLLLTVSALAALYFKDLRGFSGQVLAGGEIGRVLAKGLVQILNPIGVAVVLWTMAAVLVIFYSERSLAEWFRSIQLLAPIWLRAREMAANLGRQLAALRVPTLAPAYSGSGRVILREEPTFSLRDRVAEPPATLVEDVTEGAQPSDEMAPEKIEISKPVSLRRRNTLPAQAPRRVANWVLPKLQLLEDHPAGRTKFDEREVKAKAKTLTEKLAQFDILGEVVGIRPGPAVTMFEFKPAADVKISRITELADDLSLALSSESVRIIAPIPGRDVVGIETSNSNREAVFLKDVVTSDAFWSEDCKLPLPLGRRADGEPRVVDLRKMPHLLVAGTTGSGKSVFVVSVITALTFRHSPKTLKLILVDPKQVDLAAFGALPHLVMPPIREPKLAVGALRWAIREMEKRYRSMSKFGARGLESFNEIVSGLSSEQIEEHEAANAPIEGRQKQDSYYFSPLPYIVIVVEEFGDLMAVDRQNVEHSVVRLAQMARACGIHLILAMQSPRKDVVTGLIKTNIPGRISFKVASKMDSRIILDDGGAERLLARGDMLFLAPGVSKPERHHGPFVSEMEISAVVRSWSEQGSAEFDPMAMRAIDGGEDSLGGAGFGDEGGNEFEDLKDDRYDEILAYVSTLKEVSASLLQRRFRLGYPRAARMIEHFENEGIVGPANGSKPRQVLIKELR